MSEHWNGLDRRKTPWLEKHRNNVMLVMNAVTSIVVIVLMMLFIIQNAKDSKQALEQTRQTSLGNRQIIREIRAELNDDHTLILKAQACILRILPEDRNRTNVNRCIRTFRTTVESKPNTGGHEDNTPQTPSPDPTDEPTDDPTPRPSPSPKPSPSPSPTPSPEQTCTPEVDDLPKVCLEEAR